ncbi:MAG: DUF2971 domain-containing protein [Dorea sp.]|jgi:hypothetical protein|nr:DUF2971 domain-containing protein [Dorea sp.]
MQITNAILELIKESNNPLSGIEIAYILNCSEEIVDQGIKFLFDNDEIIKIGTGRPIKYGVKKNIPIYQTYAYVTDFKKITNANELISYLCNINDRLKKTSSLCQYTSLKAVINIISNGYWYLGSPKNMNDGLELQQGLNTKDNIFFSSFMAEQKESIAMWSMYAQPWEDGVMISIPVKAFKQWIKDIKMVYSADPKTKKVDRDTFVFLNKAKISVTRVAYSNQGPNGEIENITCGNAQNDILKSIYDSSLIGYIKDEAWSYEKEVRLRVDLGAGIHYKGVAIDVPDYVIDSMTIIKGPRFYGDLVNRLEAELDKKMRIESSLFFDKLKYTPCDGCSYRR